MYSFRSAASGTGRLARRAGAAASVQACRRTGVARRWQGGPGVANASGPSGLVQRPWAAAAQLAGGRAWRGLEARWDGRDAHALAGRGR
jgi:hypothetical protein